jgi:hypothetical protein
MPSPIHSLSMKNQLQHAKSPGGAGPFAILWAAASGDLDGNVILKRELGFFLMLQVFSIGLAVLSGWLGYSRALTFFSGIDNPQIAALFATVFVAAAGFIFVNHVSSRIAFRAQGGIFARGQFLALMVSCLLAAGVIFLDFSMNKSGVAPATRSITTSAASSQADGIISSYDAQIAEAQAALKKHEAGFTWKGNVWVPARGKSTKWHSADKVESYYRAEDRVQQLLDAKATALSNDGQHVAIDANRYQEEIASKHDILDLIVGIMYVLMFLATFRAALYSNLVMDWLDANPYGDIPGTQEDIYGERKPEPTAEDEEHDEDEAATLPETRKNAAGYPRPGEHVQGQEKGNAIGYPVARAESNPPGKVRVRDSSPTLQVQTKKVIELSNQAPAFSSKVQPDEYRGIDMKKYRVFVRISKVVLQEMGRYNLTEISNRVGCTRKTAAGYLKVALDKGDLEK